MSADEIDLETARQRLLEYRDEILALTASSEESSQAVELDQTRVGRLSRMDALQMQSMSIEAKRRRELELVKIEAALRRIDEGEYGYCLSCGEAISEKRLEIDLVATQCIQCASNAENA
jgi:DnaK suppressor protein